MPGFHESAVTRASNRDGGASGFLTTYAALYKDKTDKSDRKASKRSIWSSRGIALVHFIDYTWCAAGERGSRWPEQARTCLLGFCGFWKNL